MGHDTRSTQKQEHHGIAAFYPEKWPRVSMICKSAMPMPATPEQKHTQKPFLMKQDLFIHLACYFYSLKAHNFCHRKITSSFSSTTMKISNAVLLLASLSSANAEVSSMILLYL